MVHTDSTPSDFTRQEQPATSDPIVVFVTTYSGFMTVSPEETDAMLARVYGPGRQPGYEGRRWDRGGSPREPKPHGACERCGEPMTWGARFCSRNCYRQWVEEHKPAPPTAEELFAEMQTALGELRASVEGEE